jgi:putative heme-binding domain-containing protein
VGSQGGQVGPDLTRVGAVRSRSDLLESVVYPSSTFAQGFEPYEAVTADGRVLSGVIARQDDAGVVLRGASGAEAALGQKELSSLRRGERSVMPEGLDRALEAGELRDLFAFLQSLR